MFHQIARSQVWKISQNSIARSALSFIKMDNLENLDNLHLKGRMWKGWGVVTCHQEASGKESRHYCHLLKCSTQHDFLGFSSAPLKLLSQPSPHDHSSSQASSQAHPISHSSCNPHTTLWRNIFFNNYQLLESRPDFMY